MLQDEFTVDISTSVVLPIRNLADCTFFKATGDDVEDEVSDS